MMTAELTQQTRVALPLVMSLLGMALGAGVTWGAITSAVSRVERIEGAQHVQNERLSDHQSRLLLLERAVLSLERIAQERGQ